MAHTIEIFMPVYSPSGEAFPDRLYEDLERELVDQFGGVTSFARSPAQGKWRQGEAVTRDDIIVFEVMVEDLDADWWSDFRVRMEQRFQQEEIVIRAHQIRRL